VLRPEEAIHAHLDLAALAGADLRFGEQVAAWTAREDEGVVVRTARGRFEARRLVLAPGPWAASLFQLPELPLEVERQALHWFEPVGGAMSFSPDRFPIYIWDLGGGVQFYGFPSDAGPPGGVKVAFFRTGSGPRCTADTVERTVAEAEVDAMRAALRPRIPSLAGGRLIESVTCLYTLTPDHHFVIGLHPRHPQVVLASPCSGHGYKFASVVGEILADLATAGTTSHPIDLFSPRRQFN
jgi:sarcosine oxidase